MHKLYVPIDDDTWDMIETVAEEEDRDPRVQAARWLRQKAQTEQLQRGETPA